LPVLPLSQCSVGGPALGMDLDIVDSSGRPVNAGVTGELICRGPWPSMTRGFRGAPERYLDGYWRRWPGVWAHGDWVSRDADGAWYVQGRSDDTMNLAGKRVGPAEVETTLLTHPLAAEAAAFGVADAVKGESLWCAVVPVAGELDASELEGQLRDLVASRLGAAFRPSRVVLVPGLPRTKSGKTMRGVLRDIASGRAVTDTSAMVDPGLADQLIAELSERDDSIAGSNLPPIVPRPAV
jgi:acetyl-CoA synthetase